MLRCDEGTLAVSRDVATGKREYEVPGDQCRRASPNSEAPFVGCVALSAGPLCHATEWSGGFLLTGYHNARD